MISGISAMMQIGNNINNLMFLSTSKTNEYFQTSLPSQDRRIMKILNTYSGPDDEVCSEVKKELNKTLVKSLYIDSEEGSSIKYVTPSKHEFLKNSCVLENKILRHRVLIKKNNDLGTYNLFSCFLKNELLCPYEVNK